MVIRIHCNINNMYRYHINIDKIDGCNNHKKA